jgi:hypothetical protein
VSASGETQFTEQPVCPHCGHAERDAWEIDFGPGCEGETETYCGACGEEYAVSKTISVRYSTEKCARRPVAPEVKP